MILLCGPGWLQTNHPPVSAFKVQGSLAVSSTFVCLFAFFKAFLHILPVYALGFLFMALPVFMLHVLPVYADGFTVIFSYSMNGSNLTSQDFQWENLHSG